MTTTRARTPQEERQHLLEALDALDINIEAFNQGRSAGWMTVSAQLFILLCDRNRRNQHTALVERVIPGFSLHPLIEDLSDRVGRYLIYSPNIRFNAESQSLELFSFDEPQIALADWLNQVIMIGVVNGSGVPISIDGLIAETRHQAGGGHYDPNVREALQAASSMTFVQGGTHLPFFAKALVTIGEYVLREIQDQLQATQANWRQGE